MDSVKKTLQKTLSWRITATITTILIAYIFVGDVQVALSIGGVEFFAKMIIYYVHERVWNRI